MTETISSFTSHGDFTALPEMPPGNALAEHGMVSSLPFL